MTVTGDVLANPGAGVTAFGYSAGLSAFPDVSVLESPHSHLLGRLPSYLGR